MDTNNQSITSEWSCFVEVEQIEDEKSYEISPSDEQKNAVASRLGVMELEALTADILVKNEASVFHVSGMFQARIIQECVVSGAPVEALLEESFDAWFSDQETAVSFARVRQEKMRLCGEGETPILDEKDDPEPLIDGKIDLGEVVVQFLSLAINPYPHADGVMHDLQDDDPKAIPDIRKNPFAVLKELKKGD